MPREVVREGGAPTPFAAAGCLGLLLNTAYVSLTTIRLHPWRVGPNA